MMDVEKALFVQGQTDALALQKLSLTMDGTTLYSKSIMVPSFKESIKIKNMNDRDIGFTCRSSEGRLVRLIQKYDSSIFIEEPEQLSSNWDFIWSTDPKDAKPFIVTDHSPYNIGDCCTDDGVIFRSIEDGNVQSPKTMGLGWEVVEQSSI